MMMHDEASLEQLRAELEDLSGQGTACLAI